MKSAHVHFLALFSEQLLLYEYKQLTKIMFSIN